MKTKLPERWKEVELGEIIVCLDGKRIPLNNEERLKIQGDIPYYGANGQLDSINKHIFDEELLLLAEDGGSWGFNEKCAYIIQEKSWVNNHAHVLRMKKEVNIKYLMYFLNYNDLNRFISGTTRGKLNQGVMNTIPIILPPLSIQQKIVSILEKAEQAKEMRKEADELTKEFLKSVFMEMFGDPVVNNKKFPIEKLNNICDVRDGTHDSPDYVSEGYPLITSKNVTNGFIDFSEINLISKEDFDLVNKRSKVDAGDIIMPMIGTIGNPVIIPENIRKFAIKNVALIKFTKTKVSNIYIQFLLNSHYFNHITSGNNRGGTQKFIALGDIRSIPIPLPPIHLQQKFASIVKEVEQMKEQQKHSKEHLDKLFNALTQKAFKGELVVLR